jgi:hypothetical protein
MFDNTIKEGERSRVRGKKYVLMLTLTVLLGTIIATIPPVKAEDTVKIYISPEPPAYIPAVDVGLDLFVDVYIESPAAWYDTTNGIVGWAMDVIVDPTVLKPVTVYGATGGYWLFDFADLEYLGSTSLLKTVHPGNFTAVSEQILSWDLPPINGHGAGDNGKLCRLKFQVLSSGFSEIELVNVYYYVGANKYPADIVGNGWYQTPPTIEANLVGRSAWKEHAHFDRSKHGNESVPDAKGTPGYQTLFAKIKNIGEANVTVLAEFRIYKDIYDEKWNTTMAEIEPGEIIVLTFDFAGKDDSPPWDAEDDGIWRIEAKCLYYEPLLEVWQEGTKIKGTKFACVP